MGLLLLNRIWMECSPLYPDEFREAADSIVGGLNTARQNIKYDTAPTLYEHLCDVMA